MERKVFRLNGFAVLLVLLVLAGALAAAWQSTLSGADPMPFEDGLPEGAGPLITLTIVWAVFAAIMATGFTVINPNEAKVVQFLGRYVGSLSAAGFQWVLPLTTKQRVTLRVRNFETSKMLEAHTAYMPPCATWITCH
ncbi:hypothetical protein ACFHYQ_27355 [Sphaerimonospora cavernae]|uniref:Band 7 domain-containing protein n=1 Tax=Sphaerimonospora cavernae TaxID=1740611 RepID=A0ABV6UCV1_9ACTN